MRLRAAQNLSHCTDRITNAAETKFIETGKNAMRNICGKLNGRGLNRNIEKKETETSV